MEAKCLTEKLLLVYVHELNHSHFFKLYPS